MQRPQPETITLDDILITEELSRRSPRSPNLLSENQALHTLARQLVNQPETMLKSLVDIALDLCCAGTAGVSLLETTPDGEEIFRWNVLAGALAQYVGGTTPRNFSPCGVCLERGTPVLFSHPDRYFTYFQAANTPIVEGLVLPLIADNHALGSIWIMSHDQQRHFDAEDVRVMTSLADLTAAALLLKQRQTGELLAINAALEAEIAEHKQTEEQLGEVQRRLELSLTGADLGVWTYSVGTNEFWADDRAQALHGHEPNEVHTFEAAGANIHPEDRDRAQAALAQVVQNRSKLQMEYRVTCKDGSVRWIASYADFVPMGDSPTETLRERDEGMFYGVVQDITERKRIEDECKQAEAAIAADLKDTQLLHELSTRLVTEGNIQTLYQEIMAAAIALTHADAGTVQILDEATQDLLLLATQGFERDLTDHFYRVNASSNTSCGRALVTGDRTFVDFDVPESEDPDGSMRIHVEAGYLSAQSTPLIARSGKALGMVSTHWRKHHRPSERELRFLDLLARQAADLIEQRQAEAALRESEEEYRSLFTSIDEAYAVVEVMTDENGEWNDFLFLEVNPAFVEQTGMEYPVGRKATELLGTPNPQWAKVYGWVAETGEPIRFEEGEATLGRVFDLYVFRLGGAGSRRVAVLFTDITDRKRREANLAFLADLMNDFAPLATAEEIMEMAGKRIAEHLDLSRYLFVEINPEAGECTYLLPSRPAGQLEIAGSYILADYHTEEENRLLWAGHSMVVNDVRDGTRSPEQIAAFEAFDIASIVNTPYLSNGRWVFDLGVTRNKPSVWREDEIELLREISARVWLRIERARAEADLRQSEARYRSLFNSMDEGYFLCDVVFDENDQPIDLFYIDENPAAIRMTGQSFRGQRLREINPNYEEYWYEIFGRVAQTGQAERLERYAAPDQIWYDFYVFKVGSDDQGRVAVVFNDITDRKRTEAQLRRVAEIDAFRVKLSDALRSLSDPVQIQAEACRLLGEQLGVDRAYYVEVNEAGGYSRINQDYVRGDSPSLVGTFSLAEYGWSVPYLRRGETITVADTQTDTIVPDGDRELMAAIGIISHISLPLIKAGELVGALCVTEAVPREWSTAEVELVRETAERIWASIERARAETELRESEIQRVREQSAREEERQRAENLAELDRAKTLFFSNISHEFRTPLTLLLAPLQDALSDCTYPLAPPHRERLELAHRNAMRLLKLVNTLLDFSRIEAGRMEAVYEPTDLAMFTTELASVFRSAIERAGLQLIVDCQPLPEPVYVDREMWEKIVLNLLSNAFKFTLEGEITVRLHPADGDAGKRNGRADRVMLQIQDTGTGIAPEHLPHLFERFYQVRGAQARTHEGSGIGLALVHELIRLQGGTIDVSSTVGQGSCFTISIPLGTAHLPSVSEAGRDSAHRLRLDVGDSPTETLRERITATRTLASTAVGAAPYVEEAERWLPQESAALRPPSPPILGGTGVQSPPELGDLGGEKDLRVHDSPASPASPARVLLVDDNADMRDYLTRILSEHVQVEAVADGASALAAVNERVPDLVLTDVMMPGLDGFELLKALRANPRTTEVPIILLSARAGEESVVEGLEAGADDYLIKPFSAQELVSRVNGHLQMAQLRLAALYQERTINRRKDELLSTVSHELNTPLVAILGWTRLLRANPSNQSMLMKSLETIERNATLQAKLIQDLLDITRISAGKLRLSLEPVELESVIEVAIASVSHLAQAKKIDLVCWGVTGQQSNIDRVLVQGDRDRLQQIICNLLTNAIKFTPDKGSINVELSVIERHNGSDASYAEISITDTGIGISAEFLPHVFDRFRQAQESSSSKGLGLGLAIARHLVELHNGSIRAESAGVGQGATFVVRLPLIEQ
jgi:PAS domain S-box-containing protein